MFNTDHYRSLIYKQTSSFSNHSQEYNPINIFDNGHTHTPLSSVLQRQAFLWLLVIFGYPSYLKLQGHLNSLIFHCIIYKKGDQPQPNAFESFLFLTEKHDTRVCAIHIRACIPLPNNDSFQNHYKITPYPEFKCTNRIRACMSYILIQFSCITWEKIVSTLPSHIRVCGLPTWPCISNSTDT